MRSGNIFGKIPASLPEELVEVVARGDGHTTIERIVSRGHASPADFWYDQERAEWVIVLAGRGRVRFDDGALVELGPGDYLEIPAHRRHRVEWTDPDAATIWLAVHYAEKGT